jgi:hypothetical protein
MKHLDTKAAAMPKAPIFVMFLIPLVVMGAAFVALREVSVPTLWAGAISLLAWSGLVLLLWTSGKR